MAKPFAPRFIGPALSRRTMLASGTALLTVALSRSPAVAATTDRVEGLIARMTVEEKIGQLNLLWDEIRPTPPIIPGPTDPNEIKLTRERQLAEVRAGRVGSLLYGTGVAAGREIQKAALESRLGIPVLFGADIVHGYHTIFPVPLGLAASFDVALAERTARSAAKEMTAVGIHQTYAPMLDVARDQRWGRVVESAGEDTYLNSLFATATVRGFQGKDLKSNESGLATPKHFAGYSAVIGGIDYNATALSERELRETFLPPFKAAFDAGAMSTMAAFVEVDAVPISANRHILTDILRNEWGFRGAVLSDWDAVSELVPHGVAADGPDAARHAILAGVDMDMKDRLYSKHLPDLVASGAVPMAVLDEAVRRVLRTKDAIGLLDNPYRSLDLKREKRDVRTPEMLALAREAAQKSVVLLRNEKDLLPLKKVGTRIALIGPLGDDPANVDGTWAYWAVPGTAVTLAAGLRKAMPDASLLNVVKGSDIAKPIDDGIEAAVAAARAADIVVLAIGEMQFMSGEAASRSEIVVPAPQQALAEAVAAVGKPVVVVLSHGRALALDGAVKNADAILAAWFLGSESGNALADILFGDVSPSGRLPVSFPQRSGQQPYFYNHKSTGRPDGAKYKDVNNKALYPFGHGLTYSRVEYGSTAVSSAIMSPDGTVTVSARVSNVGKRAVDELVQLYLHDKVASVTRPIRQLKGIRKVALKPGETATVAFVVRRQDLEFVGSDLKWIAEPGEFDVWIAPSCIAGKPATFTLAG